MDASEIDPEMAAFMGFSSFGTQPASKKRKYNHRTDAVSSPASSAAATGANQVTLATRTPTTSATTTTATEPSPNTDEIPLDYDPEAPGPAADEAADKDDEEEGGASLCADPAVAPALAHAQGLIDELTKRGGDGSESGSFDAQISSQPSGLPQRPDVSWGRETGTAPTSMPQWNRGDDARGGRGGRDQHQQQQQRIDGKPWWEGYYDPRSNENPWEKLEKAAGLELRGTWVSRGQAQSA